MSIPTDLTSSTPHTTPRSGRRHHVVVIGSGFGGLAAAKRLARADTDVTVVANTTHHLFQPLLYQVASGVLSEGEVAPPTREILRRQRNVRVLLGQVSAIDLDLRTVTSQVLGRTTVLHYDSLIVAAGARQSYFGNDQFAPFAPSLKTIDDALELRGRIFGAFELAELGAVRGEDVSSHCSPSPSSARDLLAWSWPARSPSSPDAPCVTTSGPSSPAASGCCCSMREARSCRPSDRASEPEHNGRWNGSAWR